LIHPECRVVASRTVVACIDDVLVVIEEDVAEPVAVDQRRLQPHGRAGGARCRIDMAL
jgi:hypothetical protein